MINKNMTIEQILRVDGLMVEGQDAGGKDTAGSFQVAVAIVNSDDLRVLELFHNVPLFRLFWEKKRQAMKPVRGKGTLRLKTEIGKGDVGIT